MIALASGLARPGLGRAGRRGAVRVDRGGPLPAAARHRLLTHPGRRRGRGRSAGRGDRPAAADGGRGRASRLGPRPGRARERWRAADRAPAAPVAAPGRRPRARGQLLRLGASPRVAGRLMPRLVLVSELPGAAGGPPTAAALAVACAIGDDQPVALIEVGGRRRGPTMLASSSARSLEERLRAAGRDCRARGRLASVPVVVAEGWEEELVATLALLDQTESAVVSLPPALLRRGARALRARRRGGSPVRRAPPAAGARRARGSPSCGPRASRSRWRNERRDGWAPVAPSPGSIPGETRRRGRRGWRRRCSAPPGDVPGTASANRPSRPRPVRRCRWCSAGSWR